MQGELANKEDGIVANLSVYTPLEAGKMLRIGQSKVYELLHKGEIKSIKNGRRFLIPEACIIEYLEQQLSDEDEEGVDDA